MVARVPTEEGVVDRHLASDRPARHRRGEGGADVARSRPTQGRYPTPRRETPAARPEAVDAQTWRCDADGVRHPSLDTETRRERLGIGRTGITSRRDRKISPSAARARGILPFRRKARPRSGTRYVCASSARRCLPATSMRWCRAGCAARHADDGLRAFRQQHFQRVERHALIGMRRHLDHARGEMVGRRG